MIRVRRRREDPVEEIDLKEFERRAKNGEIAPQHEVCFPAVTGQEFVPARDLELFQGLYAAGPITFKRYFHLGRFPYLTFGLILVLVLTYYLWQGGEPTATEQLLAKGAKSPTLMIERGQWWRLLSANLLHVSGWHLLVNSLFLFNLGGPTEAIFRRLDYALVLVASALGTTILSAALNPSVSCGASGVVFGVWGAAAVFGVRHRSILPDRYRRYFIWSVIPYSIFALYIGFAMTGVDNWGHLGGLGSGCITAAFLPARLLHPRDRSAPVKLTSLAIAVLLLAAGSFWPLGAGELTRHRYFPRDGLVVPIPQRWSSLPVGRTGAGETYAFENQAGVAIALETELRRRPVQLERLVREFVENDLARQLEVANIRGVRVLDPEAARLAGLEAMRIRTELLIHGMPTRTDFFIFGRGYLRYVVSLTSPIWLASDYAEELARILAGISLVDPNELISARRQVETRDEPATHATLAMALAHAGRMKSAGETLDAAIQRWPQSAEPHAARARLLWETGGDLPLACADIRLALMVMVWTPELLALAIDLHRSCGEEETAGRIVETGLQRFGGEPTLLRRRRPPADTP